MSQKAKTRGTVFTNRPKYKTLKLLNYLHVQISESCFFFMKETVV